MPQGQSRGPSSELKRMGSLVVERFTGAYLPKEDELKEPARTERLMAHPLALRHMVASDALDVVRMYWLTRAGSKSSVSNAHCWFPWPRWLCCLCRLYFLHMQRCPESWHRRWTCGHQLRLHQNERLAPGSNRHPLHQRVAGQADSSTLPTSSCCTTDG